MKGNVRAALVAATAAALLAAAPGSAADPGTRSAETPQHETRVRAADAHREAVDDALTRIKASTRLDLDVDLPGRASAPASGD